MGDKDTWRGRRAGGLVLELLDRAIASNDWYSLYPGTKVRHLNTHASDHKAIVINLEGIVPQPNRPFKFEQMWLRDNGCSETINSAWSTSTRPATMPLIMEKLRNVGRSLQNGVSILLGVSRS